MIIKFSMPRHVNIKRRIYVVVSLFVAEGLKYCMFVRFNETLSFSFISHSFELIFEKVSNLFCIVVKFIE
jgi:hypothetical protein